MLENLQKIILAIINQQDKATNFSEFHRLIRPYYNVLSYTDYITLAKYAYANSDNNIELRNITLTCSLLAYIKIINEKIDIPTQNKYSNDIFNRLFNFSGETIKTNQFLTQELADVELQIALNSFFSRDEKYLIELGNFYSYFAYNTGSSFYLKRAINFYNIAIHTTDDAEDQAHYHLVKFEFITNYLSKHRDPNFQQLNQTARTHLSNPNWEEKRRETMKLWHNSRMQIMYNNEFESNIVDFNSRSEYYYISSIMWITELKEIELKNFDLRRISDRYKIALEQLTIHKSLISKSLDLLDDQLVIDVSSLPMTISSKYKNKIDSFSQNIASLQFYLTFRSIIEIITISNIALANNQLNINPDCFFRQAEFIENNFLREAIDQFCLSPKIDLSYSRKLKEITLITAIELASGYKDLMVAAKDISAYMPGEEFAPNAISLASFAAAFALKYFASNKIVDSPEHISNEIIKAIMNTNLQSQDEIIQFHANFFVANKLSFNNTTQTLSNPQTRSMPPQRHPNKPNSTARLMSHTSQPSNNPGRGFTPSPMALTSSTSVMASSSSMIIPRQPFSDDNCAIPPVFNNRRNQPNTLFRSIPIGNNNPVDQEQMDFQPTKLDN